nr:MAG TPA: hypothetical protein [Caudoviricetes sp.]
MHFIVKFIFKIKRRASDSKPKQNNELFLLNIT